VTAVAPVTTPVTTPLEPAPKPEPTTPEPAKADTAKPEAAKPEEAKAETAPAAVGKAAAHHPHKAKHAVAPSAPSEPAMPKMMAGPKPAPLAAIQSPDAKKEQAPVKLEGEGTLLLASSPWCNVKIDGVDKGPTPISVKLPAGKHTVVLTNPEFKINRTTPVMILPNETNRKRFDF
jgi:serine/threonine-protein kinase